MNFEEMVESGLAYRAYGGKLFRDEAVATKQAEMEIFSEFYNSEMKETRTEEQKKGAIDLYFKKVEDTREKGELVKPVTGYSTSARPGDVFETAEDAIKHLKSIALMVALINADERWFETTILGVSVVSKDHETIKNALMQLEECGMVSIDWDKVDRLSDFPNWHVDGGRLMRRT